MQNLLKQYIDQNKTSQSEVSKQIGLSTATISQWLKGIYKGDVEAVETKVKQFLERKSEKTKRTGMNTDFVETYNASRIIETCQHAHVTGSFGVVVGDAGLGKTYALKHYAKTNTNVILIEVDPTFSPKVLLIDICSKLGIVPSRSNHDNMVNIVDMLTGSDKLIIVDEAELLTTKALELIRRIHDKAEVGILLAGMPRLRANLRGSRGDFKQIFSRVNIDLDLQPLTKADVGLLSETALGTNAFNDKLAALSKGNARRLTKLIQGAYRISAVDGLPIDNEAIEESAKLLMV